MTGPLPQPGIMDIARYVGGAAAERPDGLKLSSNENPYGPSPKAIAAIRDVAAKLHLYPNTHNAELRSAIAERHGLDADLITCGAGSDELLSLLAYGYAGPGDEAITTTHGFAMYPIVTRAAGATPVVADERERVVDPDALLAAVSPRTKLVFIANPANPTGTMLSLDRLAELADALPPTVILVLDGAYAEFAPGYDGGAKLVESRANVVMTRSFSKLHGLGGLRLGWAYAPAAITEVLARLRGPFNLGLAQLEGGLAAIQDRAWQAQCLQSLLAERSRLLAGLRQLGLACDDSHANFVLPRFGGAEAAESAEAALRAAGLITRKTAGYGIADGLRITVGTAEATDRVLAALRQWSGP